MIAEKNLYISANFLIERHGDEAELIAALRVDELLEKGDVEGEQLWLRILATKRSEVDRAGWSAALTSFFGLPWAQKGAPSVHHERNGARTAFI